MPRIRKKTSKRGTTHQRTKIRQKVRETHKKRKKESKKNTQWKSKHKKDPGIPSSLPFKEDILAEIEATRRQAEEDKQRRKDAKVQSRSDEPVPSEPPATSTAAFTPTSDDDTPPILIDSSLPNLGAVIDGAHAVLYVLDARDPLSFRSTCLEDIIAKKDKRLIIILTKTDLVPREILAVWLAYFREQLPSVTVVPTRSPEAFIQTTTIKGKQKVSFESVSKDNLLSTLAEATKSQNGHETRVAVVGLTNSGKSTLLNSLLSAPSLPTYKQSIQQPKKATFQTTTEGAQPVQVTHGDRTFTFIDTPGLSFIQFNSQPGSRKLTPEEVEASKAKDLLLRNRGSFVHWKETDAAAAHIVSRAKHQDLMLHYNVPAFTPGDVTAFLGGVARASGRIRKHGVLDLPDTARSITRDWSLGNLPYFALPPASSAAPASGGPVLDACLTLKEIRAPPRPWPTQLDAGVPDERDVDLEAPYAVLGVESATRRNGDKMEVDGESEEESEDEEDDDEEMGSAESGSEDDEEDELDDDESEEESEEEPLPPPKSKKVSFNTKPQPRTKPKPTPAKLKPASKPKPAPAPRRIGNVVAGGKKSKVVAVAGEESYDFSKFF